MNFNCQEKIKLHKFNLKRRIFSLIHNSIFRWIWFHFTALCFGLLGIFSHNISDFHFFFFFGQSSIEEIWIIEVRIWCIKIGCVWILHLYQCLKWQSTDSNTLVTFKVIGISATGLWIRRRIWLLLCNVSMFLSQGYWLIDPNWIGPRCLLFVIQRV
jgi:hypothetical protein